jgi:hypothetical protein
MGSGSAEIIKAMELKHEDRFQASIKSCLPAESDKCKTFIPDAPPGKARVQRIAVLTSASVLHRVEQVKLLHATTIKEEPENIDVIFRSSVPPYGYGKTHGLTKIIRLQPQPLLLEVTGALQSVLESGETLQSSITLADVKAATRQILRFHCRLSHVAAHTAMLSIKTKDLFTAPENVSRQLKSFCTPHETIGEHQVEAFLKRTILDGMQSALDAQKRSGTELLNNVQAVYRVDVREAMDDVLLDELNKTKSFSTWPCLSFWTAGDEPDPLNISPIVQRIAKALSPDCDDALANCWVARDKCEARADGLCHE